MAYWIVKQDVHGRDYMCDTEADIAKLPTQTRKGVEQEGIDSTSTMTTQAGSTATVIATGNKYILQHDSDRWVLQPVSGGGGGSGTQGRDGLDVIYCSSIAVTVGITTTLQASEFDIPSDRTIDVGDLCICKNGIMAQVTEVIGDDITVTGLFKMSGDGYVASYEYIQSTPAATWVIQHNLGVSRPSVTCYDDDVPESEIVGTVTYQDENTVIVYFGVELAGRAIIQG